MKFITPSFPSHGFGHLDLNAIARKTSPAISFRREHLTGKQYAQYLEKVADYFQIPVYTGVDGEAGDCGDLLCLNSGLGRIFLVIVSCFEVREVEN
ncbi:MAG: NAD(P)-binding domain-containing protein [Leptodesmis sp.]|uniref:NAD(P)-binding domain-containing protein n=1 Tax=Leptodesmis sp. TaxID=3100501 RepID=UPI003D11DD63